MRPTYLVSMHLLKLLCLEDLVWTSSIQQNMQVFKKKKRGKRARVTSTKTTESQVRVMSPRTRSIARRHRRKMVVDQFSLSKLQRLSEVLRRKESSVYLRHIGTGKFANVYKVSNALGSSEHAITTTQHICKKSNTQQHNRTHQGTN